MATQAPQANSTAADTERWVLLAAVLASSMAFIDATALNVALPAIQKQLRCTGAELLWILNAYALVVAALLLLGGGMGDRFGRKRMFIVGIGLFAVASLACGGAANTKWLIAARAFQGLGAALMIPGSLSLISSTFEPSRRGRAIGTWSAFSVIMTALGPILGGLFAHAGFWRGVFWINLPLAVLCLAILVGKVPKTRGDGVMSGPPDYAGAVLSVLGLAALNYGLIESAARSWHDPLVAAALTLGAVCLAAFIWVELRATDPLLPLSMFRDRTLIAACLQTLCFYSGLFGTMFFLSLNLIQVQHYNPAVAGLAQLPLMLLVVVVSPLAGRLVDRHDPRLSLTAGGSLAAVGFLLLARPELTSGPDSYWTTFLPPLALLGLAMGLSATPLSTTVMNRVQQHQMGVASGLNATLSRLSAVLGVAVLGMVALFVFDRSLTSRAPALNLTAAESTILARESKKLVEAIPPPGMPPAKANAVKSAIKLAYVTSFRMVSYVCAVSVASSTLLVAWLLPPKTTVSS